MYNNALDEIFNNVVKIIISHINPDNHLTFAPALTYQ
jgi:hypothetical protein